MLGKALTTAAAGAAAGGLGVEDVFSTWLYDGNGSTQTITNGIDLAGEGGLTWIKCRNAADANVLYDTERGGSFFISSNTTAAQSGTSDQVSFQSTGFTAGINSVGNTNTNGNTYASWTFRKAPGFFDVVTFTGTGSVQTIAHNLKSVPGCIFIKRTDDIQDWAVYHRSIGSTKALSLNLAGNPTTSSTYFNDTDPTSTEFTVGTDASVNFPTGTYVAYLFAHDEQIFGDTSNESVIKCGSFTTDASGNATVDLGWEPQWVLVKADGNSNWYIVDNMRGWFTGWNNQTLYSNLNDAESTSSSLGNPTSTGFYSTNLTSSSDYIYIAIRRGPMKTPESATEVFSGVTYTGTGNDNTQTVGFAVDAVFSKWRTGSNNNALLSRLTAAKRNYLLTDDVGGEQTKLADVLRLDNNTGYTWLTSDIIGNSTSQPYINYAFRRAPRFFDVVTYTGNGSTTHDVSHNLGVPPEIIITKRRDATSTIGWLTSSKYYYNTNLWDRNGRLNDGTIGFSGGQVYGPDANITPTQFRIATNTDDINASGGTYIAYLFATCPGVSKCGGYTGTGTTLSIDCGFTNGARFVLIKRADAAGDWYVWDTARGIVSGNDPYLLLNSTAAEVTNTDYIDPYSAGFEISSTASAAINVIGGTYIYLAIA